MGRTALAEKLTLAGYTKAFSALETAAREIVEKSGRVAFTEKADFIDILKLNPKLAAAFIAEVENDEGFRRAVDFYLRARLMDVKGTEPGGAVQLRRESHPISGGSARVRTTSEIVRDNEVAALNRRDLGQERRAVEKTVKLTILDTFLIGGIAFRKHTFGTLRSHLRGSEVENYVARVVVNRHKHLPDTEDVERYVSDAELESLARQGAAHASEVLN